MTKFNFRDYAAIATGLVGFACAIVVPFGALGMLLWDLTCTVYGAK